MVCSRINRCFTPFRWSDGGDQYLLVHEFIGGIEDIDVGEIFCFYRPIDELQSVRSLIVGQRLNQLWRLVLRVSKVLPDQIPDKLRNIPKAPLVSSSARSAEVFGYRHP